MNKKIILVIAILTIVFLMTGCQKTIDINGNESDVVYGLVVVDRYNSNTTIAYDPRTLICYLVIDRLYSTGISPYYIVSECCVPEIAIYGVNYKQPGSKYLYDEYEQAIKNPVRKQ